MIKSLNIIIKKNFLFDLFVNLIFCASPSEQDLHRSRSATKSFFDQESQIITHFRTAKRLEMNSLLIRLRIKSNVRPDNYHLYYNKSYTI